MGSSLKRARGSKTVGSINDETAGDPGSALREWKTLPRCCCRSIRWMLGISADARKKKNPGKPGAIWI